MTRLAAVHSHPSRARKRLAAFAVVATAMSSLAVAVAAAPALAASITSGSFTGGAGTFTAAGTLYAKQGSTLTLTVNTDSQAKCVAVSGAFTARIPNSSSPFVFTTTAPVGNGLQQVAILAGNSASGSSCQGNTAASSASYTLDNVAPTASATLSPLPNGAGWNKANVSIAWTGADTGGSGVASLNPATDSVSAEGTVTKTTTVTDNLGNSGTGSVQVRLDKTAPGIIGSRTPAANAGGWNNTDVTVSFTPTDALSGVKSTTPPTILAANAANQSVTGTATDDADNSTSTTVSGINIDKVAPTLSGTPTTSPNAAGWYRGERLHRVDGRRRAVRHRGHARQQPPSPARATL